VSLIGSRACTVHALRCGYDYRNRQFRNRVLRYTSCFALVAPSLHFMVSTAHQPHKEEARNDQCAAIVRRPSSPVGQRAQTDPTALMSSDPWSPRSNSRARQRIAQIHGQTEFGWATAALCGSLGRADAVVCAYPYYVATATCMQPGNPHSLIYIRQTPRCLGAGYLQSASGRRCFSLTYW